MLGRLTRRFGLATLAAAAGVPAAAQPADPEVERIVYHVNGQGGENFAYYRQLLRNLGNHLTVLTPGRFDLRVVMHGAGLNLLRRAARAEPQIAAAIDELKLGGVRFEVCRITLRLDGIDPAELYDLDERDLVPSGVGQVARLQRDGFSYLKI